LGLLVFLSEPGVQRWLQREGLSSWSARSDAE